MDILEILDEYIEEIEFIPHPYMEMPLEFRYTYAAGVTMGLFADTELDFSAELLKFYRGLKIEDKAEEIKAIGKEPSKELLKEVVKILEGVFQRQMFLLDIRKISNKNKKVSKKLQKFYEGMMRVLELTQEQKKAMEEYIELFINSDMDALKILECCSKKIEVDMTSRLIMYFYKPVIKEFVKQMNKEITSFFKLPKNDQTKNKLKNYRDIRKKLLSN